MSRPAVAAAVALLAAGCTRAPAEAGWAAKVTAGTPLYATIKTSAGDVTVLLYSKDAPKTVKNFVGLATGEREWKHPATGDVKKGVPLYSGTVFHRVIPDFMIQGGDPLGSGTGDPGYSFEDEVQSGRGFDRPGVLAMANAGPNTNGSQFFITTATPTHLNGKHTIFGEVVKGYEVVEAISRAPTNRDRPLQPVTITQIVVSETKP